VNLGSFVQNLDVRPLQKLRKPVSGRLHCKVIAMNRAQQERAQTAAPAKLQELAGIGQFVDGMLDLLEVSVEPGFQLRQRQVRGVAAVELNERQTEFGAKLFQSKFRKTRLTEDIIRGLPNGGQVVY
jgi:hypothetical protein